MFKEIIQLTGKGRRPTSIILAGVHGNEKCGIEALDKILPALKIARGKVFFGYGNPRAIEANRRFMETNLNRMFKDDDLLSKSEKASYEYKRALFLKKYLNQADALLDIHASFTPNSKPFAICEANAMGIMEFLPVGLIVSGFDKIEPGGTDNYMNGIGKTGICVECGYLGNPKSAQIAKEAVFAFLKARGHMPNDVRPKQQSHILISELYLTKTNNFSLSKSFDDFEEVSTGQIIGVDGRIEVKAAKNGVILFAGNQKQVGAEAFLFGDKKNSFA